MAHIMLKTVYVKRLTHSQGDQVKFHITKLKAHNTVKLLFNSCRLVDSATDIRMQRKRRK